MTTPARRVMDIQRSVHWACFKKADGKSIDVSEYRVALEGGPLSRVKDALVSPLWSESDLDNQLRVAADEAVWGEQ